MKQVIIFLIIVVVVVGVGWAVYQSQQGTVSPVGSAGELPLVKIGVMAPLTGDVAVYGQSVKSAVEFAAEEAGLENIELIFEDSKCEGKEAANAVNKLINVDKVVAIIGELCSGATLAAAPVAEANQVVLVSPASTSPDISDSGDYIYRTVPSDALQGAFGAELVASQGLTRLAVLYTNDDYGQGFESVLQAAFPALGGTVVASEAVERGATDARTQLTKIKAATPDALYIISNSTAATVSVLKQIKELEISATIFGSEGLKSSDIIEGAGEAAEGMIISSVSAGTSGFINRYKERFGADPGPFAAQAFDAYMILAEAFRSGAATGPEIKKALDGISYEGASGSIIFDEHGDVTGGYDVVVVANGEFLPTRQSQ